MAFSLDLRYGSCKNVRKQGSIMLAKLTSKNQLTLPKRIIEQFGDVRYFSVETEYGRIILEPVNTNPLSAVREKMDALGLTEKDVQEAVTWSRKRK
jgi:bifunctional DNA-binding transcriptional regulator/antitoxin component of YhaV-PrlF toxin-antitoxin module